MTTNTVDRGYTNLLRHLQQPTLFPLPLETVNAAIANYLVHLPPIHPTPTPLTATVVGSPLWRPLTLSRATKLANSFRQALHLKYKELEKRDFSLLAVSTRRAIHEWTSAVLNGLRGGNAVVRLCISGGLLMGLEDIRVDSGKSIRRKVEEEIVLCLAELLNEADEGDNAWQKEFSPAYQSGDERLHLALILVSQYSMLLCDETFGALALPSVIEACMSMIQAAFYHGHFAKHVNPSSYINGEGKLQIKTDTPLQSTLLNVSESHVFRAVASLSRLVSRAVDLCATQSSQKSSRLRFWEKMKSAVGIMEQMASQVDKDWTGSELSAVTVEKDIAVESREISTQLWVILKTLLFSSVMISQAVLASAIYTSPASRTSQVRADRSNPEPVPTTPNVAVDISTGVLRFMLHLAFVVSKFGGVLATTRNDDGSPTGFKEMKRIFYTALDILSTDRFRSGMFVQTLVRLLDHGKGSNDASRLPTDPTYTAKLSLAFACIEQLIPVLDGDCIESIVVPLCMPHIWDASHRETFESAHSVILAIFAAASSSSTSAKPQTLRDEEGTEIDLRKSLLLGYAKALLDNSKEGGLSTLQLRLAYSTLVASMTIAAQRDCCGEDLDATTEALASYCVEALIDAVHLSRKPLEPLEANSDTRAAHTERLALTLISLISNVSFSSLPRVLDEVRELIDAEKDGDSKQRLMEAVFDEIVEKVGYTEKEYAMEWWGGIEKSGATT